jgi:hypothetical protein
LSQSRPSLGVAVTITPLPDGPLASVGYAETDQTGRQLTSRLRAD